MSRALGLPLSSPRHQQGAAILGCCISTASSQGTRTHAAFWPAVVTTFVKSCSGSEGEIGGVQRQSSALLRFSSAVRTHHTTRGSLEQAGAMEWSHSIFKPFSKRMEKPSGRCTLPVHLRQSAALLLLFIGARKKART